jgi:ankyrin repeat protein
MLCVTQGLNERVDTEGPLKPVGESSCTQSLGRSGSNFEPCLARSRSLLRMYQQTRKSHNTEELIRDSDITLLRDVCEAMLLSNVDFECKIARPGRTPLHVAAYYWQSEAIGVLLDYGAFIHTVDDLGRTALHIAAQGYGHSSNALDTIGKLLQEGASLETKDKYGKVALDYATGDVKYHLLSCTCHRYRSEFEI